MNVKLKRQNYLYYLSMLMALINFLILSISHDDHESDFAKCK